MEDGHSAAFAALGARQLTRRRGRARSALAAEGDKRRLGVAIIGMPRQIVLEHRHGFVAAAERMQGDGVDVGVSGFAGIELGGVAQFVERFVAPLEPHEREAEGVVQAGILRGDEQRGAQDVLAVGLAAELAIQIGEVGGGGCVVRT
jgi:hypothetical protein